MLKITNWYGCASALLVFAATGNTAEPNASTAASSPSPANQAKRTINNLGEANAANGYAEIGPYTGPTVKGVNTQTLFGKVMCGYQGWFGAPGDGSSDHGWRHWTKSRGPLADGNA